MLRRKTRVRSVSLKRAAQQRLYSQDRKAWLAVRPWCERCAKERGIPVRSTDVHHTRGRAGRLLCDVRHWVALCRGCHDWVQMHPREARQAGYLAAPGQWNVYVP